MTNRYGNYNINRITPTQLKRRWDAFNKKYGALAKEKVQLNLYVYFLHSVEKYEKAEIAKLLGVSRERIGQIIDREKSKGGEIA